jgi:hypothetical protein
LQLIAFVGMTSADGPLDTETLQGPETLNEDRNGTEDGGSADPQGIQNNAGSAIDTVDEVLPEAPVESKKKPSVSDQANPAPPLDDASPSAGSEINPVPRQETILSALRVRRAPVAMTAARSQLRFSMMLTLL